MTGMHGTRHLGIVWATAVALGVASGVAAQSNSPGPSEAPSPSLPVQRPILAAPVSRPSAPPDATATDRRPDAVVRRAGVRVEMWLSAGPIDTGGWVGATVRVTNVARSPLVAEVDTGDPSCGPIEVDLRLESLYPGDPAWVGNAAVVGEALLRQGPGSVRMLAIRPDGLHPCTDHIRERRLGPADRWEVQVAGPAIYPWRDQPLPGGVAAVNAAFEFWRPAAGGSAQEPTTIEIQAPVDVIGGVPAHPGPDRLAESIVADPGVAGWLELVDLAAGWNLTMTLPWVDPPADAAPFAGGPAPMDEVVVGISAEGAPTGSFQEVWLDPWTGEVVRTLLR